MTVHTCGVQRFGEVRVDRLIAEVAGSQTAPSIMIRDPAYPAGRGFYLQDADSLVASNYLGSYGGFSSINDRVYGGSTGSSILGREDVVALRDVAAAAGGFRRELEFYGGQPAAGATVHLVRAGSDYVTRHRAIRAGSLVGFAVSVDVVSAGDLTVALTVGGVVQSATAVTLSAGSTETTLPITKDTYAHAAGSSLGVAVTGGAGAVGGNEIVVDMEIEG